MALAEHIRALGPRRTCSTNGILANRTAVTGRAGDLLLRSPNRLVRSIQALKLIDPC